MRPSLRHSAVDVIFGIVVLLGILGLGREYVLRVELEVLHESSTRKVVYTEEDNLEECDGGSHVVKGWSSTQSVIAHSSGEQL